MTGSELRDRVAFITGGASGIGFGMARAFAEAGMKLVLADIEKPALDRACAELDGASVLGVACDVTDRTSLEAAADAAWAHYDGVDVLCNNAGVFTGGLLDQVRDADWDFCLSVNLDGVVNGLRALLPRMLARGAGGHVVNTASVAGLIAPPGLGAYVTSKYAVVGLSETLRQDLAPRGIGVSVLCPGLVRTRIAESGRNRPARFGGPTAALPGAGQALAARGIDPLLVGRRVRRAIEHNELYVFTHPGAREAVERRFEAIRRAFDAAEAPDAAE